MPQRHRATGDVYLQSDVTCSHPRWPAVEASLGAGDAVTRIPCSGLNTLTRFARVAEDAPARALTNTNWEQLTKQS